MKKTFTFLFTILYISVIQAQISTGFDGYTGVGTEPTGWTISNGTSNNVYTTAGNFGASSPSVRLDLSSESIVSPTFTGGTAIQFWGRGQGLVGASTLLVEEFVSGVWGTVISLSFSGGTLSNSATTYGPYTLSVNTTQVRLTYTKVTGNIGIDDIGISGALPVKLESFTASQTNTKTTLNWTIGAATNILNYEIEKSNDGINFNKIGTVASQQTDNYSFVDNDYKIGTFYYRLKINETNGSFYYSTVQKVRSNGKGLSINNIYPTPTKDNLTIEINSSSTSITTIELVDLNGKIVLTNNFKATIGSNLKSLSTAKLQAGMYIVRVKDDTDMITEKIIKQ
jgi:Secretion system C-terminal sorting domain